MVDNKYKLNYLLSLFVYTVYCYIVCLYVMLRYI